MLLPGLQGAWRTDEIRRQKPSPQDEMRGGMAYMNSVIFDMVPIFHRWGREGSLRCVGNG